MIGGDWRAQYWSLIGGQAGELRGRVEPAPAGAARQGVSSVPQVSDLATSPHPASTISTLPRVTLRLLRELEAEAADYDTSLLRSRMRIIDSVSFVSISVYECVRLIQFQL